MPNKTLLLGLTAAMAMTAATNSIYDFTLPAIDGKPAPLAQYKGKVILVVNVASQCGYTPQYKGLEALYEKYKDKGLVVLGFPANNFGSQEPGSNAEIQSFCSRTYHVTFPMYSKISVKGDDKAPLYQWLTSREQNPKTGGEIGWNFTKFLVGRDGKPAARFDSSVEPDDAVLVKSVEAALAH